MRVANLLIIFLLLAASTVAVLLTLGIQTGSSIYYIVAIWLGMLFMGMAVIALLRGYKRIVTRQGTANERLAELRFLTERRYEMLRGRLDRIISSVTVNQHQAGLTLSSKYAGDFTSASSDIQQLTARVQRSEQRILGRLENELLAYDKCRIRLDKLTDEVERALQNIDKN